MNAIMQEHLYNDEFPRYQADLNYLLKTILTCFCIVSNGRKVVFSRNFRESLFSYDLSRSAETDHAERSGDVFFDAYAYLFALSLVDFDEPGRAEETRGHLYEIAETYELNVDGLREIEKQYLVDHIRIVADDDEFWNNLANIDTQRLHRAGLGKERLDFKLQNLHSKVEEFDKNGSPALLADVMDSADILLDSLIDAIPGIGSFLKELLKVLKKEIKDTFRIWKRYKI